MTPKLSRKSRAGFTLVELLVVITIIVVLLALTIGAVFYVLDTQRASNTETVMRTVHKALQHQWKCVLDAADKTEVPPQVVAMAGNDMRRARVIWKCMILRGAFPMSFDEVRDGLPANPPDPYGISTQLGASSSGYLDEVGSRSAAPSVESATCLLLALSKNPVCGSKLEASDILSVADTNGDGLLELVDGYGNPIMLYRFPTGSKELDGKNPAPPGSRAAKFRNPLDPDGTLMDPTWNNFANYNAKGGVYWFEQWFFPVHTGADAASYQPTSTYMVPTLVSAGKNGKYGLGADMGVIGDPNDSNDNIYSFRLGVDKRGD